MTAPDASPRPCSRPETQLPVRSCTLPWLARRRSRKARSVTNRVADTHSRSHSAFGRGPAEKLPDTCRAEDSARYHQLSARSQLK